MKSWLDELINPITYIREFEAPRRQVIAFKKREPLNQRELLDKIINTSYNKRWPDGRIYGLDKDGQYVSHSVTPYAKSFLDNIEEGIKPLVIALKDKGYLSMSSCQGHCLWDRRFVMLVFPSKEAALEFQTNIPFNLTYKLRHATEVLNTNLDIDAYGTILNAEKKQLDNDKDNTLIYINTFVKRNYADAWLLDIIISDEIIYEHGVFKYIKNIKKIIFKKYFLNWYTNRLVEYIKKKLPTNIY